MEVSLRSPERKLIILVSVSIICLLLWLIRVNTAQVIEIENVIPSSRAIIGPQTYRIYNLKLSWLHRWHLWPWSLNMEMKL